MTAIKKLDGLHIEAKRWFQKSAGNTYHSVSIYANGEQIAYLPFNYGYGEQWLQTALDWLEFNGYIQRRRHSNGVLQDAGTIYLRETLHGTYNVSDVERKKDL